MPRTLITGLEVVNHAPTSYRDEALAKCPYIHIVEEALFHECLGIALYNDMLSDIVDYSSVGAFREQQPYTVGSNVIVNGIIYTCIQATTSQTVANSNFWQVAIKFNNPAYQELWTRYLAMLIATNVQIHTLATQAVSVSAAGVTRSKSENYNPATLAEVSALRESLDNTRIKMLKTMLLWLGENIADYPLYEEYINANKASCQPKQGCSTRSNFNFF